MSRSHITVGVYPRQTGRIIVAPLHLGLHRGHFAEADLDVTVAEPADHPWYAAGRGDIDCGLSFIDYCAWDQLRSKIVAVAVHEQFFTGQGMTCLMGRTELLTSGRLTADPASIRGLRIGLLPGRGDDYLCFKGVLDQGGLSFDEVERVPVPHGGKARRGFVHDGQVDVLLGRRPASVVDEVAEGQVRVWKQGDDVSPDLQARYFVANTDFLRRSRPVMHRFLAAYLRGVRDVLDSYRQAAAGDTAGLAVLSELTGEPVDRMLSIKPVGYHPTGRIDADRLAREVDQLRAAGLFPRDLPVSEVVDLDCVEEARSTAPVS